VLMIFLLHCSREMHCENAVVYRSQKCGVEWEIELGNQRYPAQDLPQDLQRDGNRIFLRGHHFYTDPALCPCCGYTYLVVEDAVDEAICL
jgi:hypothetical protein